MGDLILKNLLTHLLTYLIIGGVGNKDFIGNIDRIHLSWNNIYKVGRPMTIIVVNSGTLTIPQNHTFIIHLIAAL